METNQMAFNLYTLDSKSRVGRRRFPEHLRIAIEWRTWDVRSGWGFVIDTVPSVS